MNPYQMDIEGYAHPTHSGNTILTNLRKLYKDNRRIIFKDANEVAWIYLQEFCGVSDAISREQYFTIPQPDSIRRKWDDLKKEIRNQSALNTA